MKSLLPTTYGELKCRKAELRNQLEKEIMESGGNFNKGTCDEYRLVLRAIKWTETWLLWTIVSLILIFGGCNTARSTLNLGKSIGQDGAWILGKMSDNIQTQEK